MARRHGISGRGSVVRRRASSSGPAVGDASETMQELLAERAWARDLEPDRMTGVGAEVTMLRQTMRDAFLVGDAAAVRQCAEALRRLLRERAIVPEMDDSDGEEALEDGLSADLRRILHRVGLEMGVDA